MKAQPQGGAQPQLRNPKVHGRPRSQETCDAILGAARHLARTKKRYSEISIEGIAQGAGVAKTTIYRWWKSKGALVEEACFASVLRDPCKDSLIADLTDLVEQEVNAYQTCATRGVIAGVMAEFIEYRTTHLDDEGDAPMEEMFCQHERDLTRILEAIFQRAHGRGEATGQADTRAMSSLVEMCLYHYCICRSNGFAEDQRKQLVQQIRALG